MLYPSNGGFSSTKCIQDSRFGKCKLEKHATGTKLSEEQIEEITDNLDCGITCFYSLKTGGINTLLNFDSWIGADQEPWEEEAKEIDENLNGYFEFEGLGPQASFQIKAEFAQRIDDPKLQGQLTNALNRPKPFRNSKWQIDNSVEFRQLWFDYKKMRYIQWVKGQIDINGKDF